MVLRRDGIFTAYNSKQMCRAGAITPVAKAAGARAQRHGRGSGRCESRAHHVRAGLMLMATSPRVNWSEVAAKQNRSSCLSYFHCSLPHFHS